MRHFEAGGREHWRYAWRREYCLQAVCMEGYPARVSLTRVPLRGRKSFVALCKMYVYDDNRRKRVIGVRSMKRYRLVENHISLLPC
jgi:hypothetical protein